MPQRTVINSNVEAKTTGHSDVGDYISNAVVQGLCSERAAVWFDCRAYERAESHYFMRLQECQNGTTSAASTSNSQHSQENSLIKAISDQSTKRPGLVTTPRSLHLLPDCLLTHTLCDEGYLSQTPTPATPASMPINGLPFVPAFLQGVWFQKPIYDRAEATFYKNLYRAIEPHSKPNEEHACLGHPLATVTNKAKSDKTKEKKPGDDGVKKGSSALCHFLHADSERVWLDRGRYEEAETRFYEAIMTKTNCSLSLKYEVDYIHTHTPIVHPYAPEWRNRKCSPYRQEFTSLNPDDATAIRGQEPREQNWPCSLGGMDGISLSPVNNSNTCRSQVAVRACM